MHEKRFTGFERATLEHIVPDREESLRYRAGLLHWIVRGNGQGVAFMRKTILRVAAADHERHHLVADLPARHAVAERDHLARDLEARNVRRAFRWRIKTLALHDIGPVDAGGGDLDQNFSRAGRGNRPFF